MDTDENDVDEMDTDEVDVAGADGVEAEAGEASNRFGCSRTALAGRQQSFSSHNSPIFLPLPPTPHQYPLVGDLFDSHRWSNSCPLCSN